MDRYIVSTPAKLNLSLVVTGKRGGLHTVDMIVCPFERFEDKVCFVPIENKIGFAARVTGGFFGLDKKRFLDFLKDKLQAIAERFQVGGKIEIFKGVPLGAGLGGSSATIACVVKAVEEYMRDVGKDVACDDDFLLSLGSDVPCMVKGGACRVSGVGEVVESLPCECEIDVEAIVAEGGCDSGKCYKLFDEIRGENYDLTNIPKTVDEAIEVLRNDLFEPACIINPHIKEAYDALKKRGYDKIAMSGSGSAVFAIKRISRL